MPPAGRWSRGSALLGDGLPAHLEGLGLHVVRDAAALRAGDGRAARRLRRRPGADLEGAPSYLAFVAPGLVAAHAMQTATGETTWPVMGEHQVAPHLLRDGRHAAAVADIVAAHLVFVLFRVATTCGVFLLVMAPFGVFESLLGRAAGVAGAGAGRARLRGPVLRLLRRRSQNESGFAIIYRLLVIPLFLFSGAFFPISNLPPALEWLARLTPLWHGVDLTRMLVLGHVRPGSALVHLAYLVVLSAGRLVARGRGASTSGWRSDDGPRRPLPSPAPSPTRGRPAGRSSGATSSSTGAAGWSS